jgi:hypothetical protein
MTAFADVDAVPATARPATNKYYKELEVLQKQFDADVELALADHIKTTSEFRAKFKLDASRYLGKLEMWVLQAKEAGDLDQVLALKIEIESITKYRTPSTVKLSPEVMNARKEYSSALSTELADYDKVANKVFEAAQERASRQFQNKAKEVRDLFLNELAELVKSETKAGMINSAVTVRDYLVRVKEILDVIKPPEARSSGYSSRNAANRKKYLLLLAGTEDSELTVDLGLAWLARQQQRDGNWAFDGTTKDQVAATGLSILPFLAAGQTHRKSPNLKENKYVDKVALGINWLLKQQKPDGSFKGSSGMYSHAIATIALCECFGMTSDKSFLQKPAQAAINFIQNAQGQDGSWGYLAKANGDTSIVGWQIQALQSGKLCKDITVDKACMKRASEFLDKVASGSTKATYGYTSPGASKTLTPVGLLCRYYMDGWGPKQPGFQAGVEFIMKTLPSETAEFNMYFYYYATRVLHFNEGEQWHIEWLPRMHDLLIKRQHGIKEPEAVRGSWDTDKGISGTHWGRLGSTCMAILTMQEYYRFTPEVRK